MTIDKHPTARTRRQDRRLVNLMSTVLVDPNLSTDTRLRLHHDIDEILRGVHDGLHGAAGREVHEHALATHDGHLPDVLESVLVDPNLHTDTRLRLHEEIRRILSHVDGT